MECHKNYGVEGLREKVRLHIKIAAELATMISQEPDFEILAPVVINVVCFRFRPGNRSEKELNAINEKLNHILNDSGKIYLSHTVLDGRYTLRMVTGQTNVSMEHAGKAWNLIKETARNL